MIFSLSSPCVVCRRRCFGWSHHHHHHHLGEEEEGEKMMNSTLTERFIYNESPPPPGLSLEGVDCGGSTCVSLLRPQLMIGSSSSVIFLLQQLALAHRS